MSQFLSELNLSQARCQQHDEIANFICLEKECEKRGLSCAICQPLYHKQHTFKPLKHFLSQLTQPQSRSHSLSLISADIDLTINDIHSQISKIPKVEDRRELQRTFKAYVQQLHGKIEAEFEVENQLRGFFEGAKANELTLERVNRFVNRLELHEYETDVRNQKPLTNQQKYLYQLLDMLRQKKDQFSSLIKSKTDIKDTLGLFMFTEVKQKLTFCFSQQLHHTSIKITQKLTAKQQHNYSSNFALIQPMIIGKKKTMSKKTVKIKIDKLNSWVNLGICVKSKAMSSSYYFSTQDVGHGAYTISNDGYSWHNTDSGMNSFYHGWSFAQGETVTMTYDPKTKMIKYSKENHDKEFELSCEPIPDEEMYFCCTLNTHDQMVSIVQ